MATDDTSLITEIRTLTSYGTTVLDDQEMQEVVDLAKRELQADTGNPSLTFYDNLQAERALFWLSCIFSKVKIGEIDAPSFSIGELDVDSYNPHTEIGLWFDNFWKNYQSMEGGAPVGHIKNGRPNRDYGFDNSAFDN